MKHMCSSYEMMWICSFIHPSIIFLAPTINRHCFRQRGFMVKSYKIIAFMKHILEEEEDNKYVYFKWR